MLLRPVIDCLFGEGFFQHFTAEITVSAWQLVLFKSYNVINKSSSRGGADWIQLTTFSLINISFTQVSRQADLLITFRHSSPEMFVTFVLAIILQM